jgi:ribosomal protein S18 acetylase RimI-like enzyme
LPTVRRATVDDLPHLSATLALSFEDYPWTDWTVAADDHRRRLAELFEADLREFGLEYGEVWVTDDRAAVAVWMPPGAAGEGAEDTIGQPEVPLDPRKENLIGDRLPQAIQADAFVEAHRPEASYWHLASLGVHPGRQGEGLGSLVLGPVLGRCDAEGLPAYTETSAHRNVAFYRRHGFGVTKELDVPGGGPHVWLMWRDPR